MLVFKIVLFCSSLYKSHFLTDIFFNSKISCLYFFFLKRKNSMYIQEIFQSYQISVRFTKPLHIQQYKYRISVLHEMTGQQVIPCKSCFHVRDILWVYMRPSALLALSKSCLPICAVLWWVVWLVRIRNNQLFLPEHLQFGSTVPQSSVDGASFLLLQLSTEQDEARDANNKGDSP